MPHNKTLYVNSRPVNIFRFVAKRGWAVLTLGQDKPSFQLSVPLSFYDSKEGSLITSGQHVSWVTPQ
jgi:hypothetical protein